MNLTRALEVALPEIPARTLSDRPPRMDPGVSFREHIESGKPVVRIYVPSCRLMFTFSPQDWELAQLFDGTRSYDEIAQIHSQARSIEYDAEEVRKFADELDGYDFWYKTSQERNILLMKQSVEQRRKKLEVRSRWADLSDVTFPAFNPDRFLTWLYRYTQFIYTAWFTILTLLGFIVTAGITITHWTAIGRDTVEFYNFSNKTWGDVFVLYTLGMGVVAVHEFAHAHACKHYGGRVPSMGFALVYLTPAFYTDTTEGFVQGSRYQRVVIALAGIWSELILCSIATPIWWGTPPETLVHDGAYFIMMMTGLMSLFINWNPLMKLDGYYMLCEIVGVRDLKEDSTAYVAAWVKHYIWRLPVDVPYVPKQRRLGFVIYALLSGTYSYFVLYIVARFAGNFVRNFSPEWGFIPEIGVAILIFRSRIRLLVNFMKFFYLDKKDRIAAWFTLQHSLILGAVVVVFLALPLWRDSVSGKFLLEPALTAFVRAHVPGTVAELEAHEGQFVQAGEPLAKLRNLPVQSQYEDTRTRFLVASDRVNAAALQYLDYGTALQEREHLKAQLHQQSEVNSALQLTSPISGTILTPKVEDLLGAYLPAGAELLEVADLSSMRARIYISEYELAKIHPGAPCVLQVRGMVRRWNAQTISIAAKPTKMDHRLSGKSELEEMNAPHYYLADLLVANPNSILKPGMAGDARIYGSRRSIASMGWEAISHFWARKLW